ncbi:hypothetical protein CesoFtcFv8_002602 [Champsocephalus esox]|uniref:Uncharacterized protein n=1 Tax=Champsocephalus esox TaxID=159716 RepID=A0AAN8CYD8_9TELE|nr:hypothetical protein CesoFtcFv8_002602 [Champsocephalus esox]
MDLHLSVGGVSAHEAVRTRLKQWDRSRIMLQYNVPDFRNSLEFLTLLAKKRGYLQKGGIPNAEQASTAFLDDWTGHRRTTTSQPTCQAGSIGLTSTGPTAGLLRVEDVTEEKPADAASESAEQNDENQPEQTPEEATKANGKQAEEPPIKRNPGRVQFESVPIDMSGSAASTGGAYDFNTDFN